MTASRICCILVGDLFVYCICKGIGAKWNKNYVNWVFVSFPLTACFYVVLHPQPKFSALGEELAAPSALFMVLVALQGY